ncbi:ubiquitin-conjugating enzyme/RWD-like protein [Fimicolochytrium jonesii]|uniref:ubiquitin-conjugating enzyme/RWD-like protein n=1 Tax=Fimicolochytrium jonesii TaxID=1396493 RepID=UPI0022FE714E|nr:ubiquitin-conjugating enzyme/RWD-like protein [Fimicolochytrium jonesii]KAI8826220.1 ubiquitin-conjugating enzyme/RWD-like protein [Fimicolochytrium jonesii]
MSFHAEEQSNELEALLSIFPDEFSLLDAGPPAHFHIHIQPDVESLIPPSDDHDATTPREAVEFFLDITYTDTYPDTIPLLELTEVAGFDAGECGQIVSELTTMAEESVGMAMGFTLAAGAKEIAERVVSERIAAQEAEAAARAAAEEEAERIRHAGTRVTPASFDQWKAEFLAEISHLLKTKGEEALSPAQKAAAAVAGLLDSIKGKSGKLTGRQLFEKDRTLASSDMAYIEDGDVTVDAELFEGMEDLDVGDDEEDEEENSVLAGIRSSRDD